MNKDVDLGILTIIPTEIEALFDIFEIKKEEILNIEGALRYWRKDIYSVKNKRIIKIIISYINKDSGNTEAAICTTQFLRDWYPKMLILVGITAGIIGKTSIGDVIIPNKVHDRTVKVYKNGKYSVRGTTYNRTDLVDSLLKAERMKNTHFTSIIKKECRDELIEAKKQIKDELKEGKICLDKFKIIDGSISSDNILIRDDSYLAVIIEKTDEKCRGGEMESAGFIRACQTERSDFPWMIFRGVSDYGNINKSDVFQLIAAKSAVIALKVYVDQFIEFDKLPLNRRIFLENDELKFDLLKQIEDMYLKKRWSEICTIGQALSRYLWLTGQHELRIRIGEFVEIASSFLNNNTLRASVLIDDIGWTNFKYGESIIAEKNIKDGQRMAAAINNYYLVAKSYRHLASLYRSQGKLDDAIVFLDLAENIIDKIEDNAKRIELSNSLLLSRGKLLIKRNDIKGAVNSFLKALEEFENSNDYERQAKVYALICEAYFKLGELNQAEKYAKDGFSYSESVGRLDEMEENAILLLSKFNTLALTEKECLVNKIITFAKSKQMLNKVKFWEEKLYQLHGGQYGFDKN